MSESETVSVAEMLSSIGVARKHYDSRALTLDTIREHKRLDAARDYILGAERTEILLRKEWWLNHRCSVSLYGDDGEMQCNAQCCMKDFKRAPLSELETHVWQRRVAHAFIECGRYLYAEHDPGEFVVGDGYERAWWYDDSPRSERCISAAELLDDYPDIAAEMGLAPNEAVPPCRDAVPSCGEDLPCIVHRTPKEAANPVPMILDCPRCGMRHVDVDDESGAWATTRHHRKHLCKSCGNIWQPHSYATVGVGAKEAANG